jgi:hypothetical protein
MKNILYPFAMSLLFPAIVLAQQLQAPANYTGNNVTTGEAIVRQLGGFDKANLRDADISIYQNGNSNNLHLDLKGIGNKITGRQNGNENTLNLRAKTMNSQYWLEQAGNGNVLSLTNITSNGINFQVNQAQNNNSLILDGAGYGQLPSLKIEQSGGMRLSIQSNTFSIK